MSEKGKLSVASSLGGCFGRTVVLLAATSLLALSMVSPTTASAARNHVADVNGDGRADRIGWNDASKWVELSTGSGFTVPQDWSEGIPFHGSRDDLVGDVNGDGRADLIGWNDASKWVQLSTGSGFSAPQDWSEGIAFYGSRANLVGDVNGDGRADLIGWNDASKWVQLSTGSGFSAPRDWFEGTAFYGSRANLVGDVNGDGRADLIGWNDASGWVQLSTGSGFSAPQDWSEGIAFYGSAAGPAPLVEDGFSAMPSELERPNTTAQADAKLDQILATHPHAGCAWTASNPGTQNISSIFYAYTRAWVKCRLGAATEAWSITWELQRHVLHPDHWVTRASDLTTGVGPTLKTVGPRSITAVCHGTDGAHTWRMLGFLTSIHLNGVASKDGQSQNAIFCS
jgi:hypothetical protein